MQVILHTMPNAFWAALVLVNVFFIAIVQTNSLSSPVSSTTKNIWLAELVLASILALSLQVQYTTSQTYTALNTIVATSLLALSIVTFIRRSGLSASQQKFAIATFAFAIAIFIKYWF